MKEAPGNVHRWDSNSDSPIWVAKCRLWESDIEPKTKQRRRAKEAAFLWNLSQNTHFHEVRVVEHSELELSKGDFRNFSGKCIQKDTSPIFAHVFYDKLFNFSEKSSVFKNQTVNQSEVTFTTLVANLRVVLLRLPKSVRYGAANGN